MKKFVALLLSFIMVFTMIPSVFGPGALAYDGTNCQATCAIHNELAGTEWEIIFHDDFEENGQTVHKIVGRNKTDLKAKMFAYTSAGDLIESYAIDSVEVELVEPSRHGHSVLITFSDSDGQHVIGYAEYDNKYLAIGSSPTSISNKESLKSDCQDVVRARDTDVRKLQEFVDDAYNHITISNYNVNGLEAFDPIIYFPGGWDVAPAKIYTKTQVNRFTARPLIEYVGNGTFVDYELDALGIFVSICDGLITKSVVGLLETIGTSVIGYITADRYVEPKFTVYFDYFFSYGKQNPPNIEFDCYMASIPLEWSDPVALGRSDWAEFIRDPHIPANEVRSWQCLRLPVLNDPSITPPQDQDIIIRQELMQRHWHTYKPDGPSGLNPCSMICPVCGFGRRWTNTAGKNHATCIRHSWNPDGYWEHVEFDKVCGLTIINWEDNFTHYTTNRVPCNCTDPEERYATDPDHVYTNCADSTCDCGFYRGVPGIPFIDGHVYDNCQDFTCNRCSYERPHTMQSEGHQYKFGPLYDDRGFALNYHGRYCELCGYNDPNSMQPHSDVYTCVDNDTCNRTCSVCGLSTDIDHSYTDWYTISDTEEESRCSNCHSLDSITTRPHVFFDETDRYCSNIGCNYDRYTATNHQYKWIGYDKRGVALSYHYQRCETCGYVNPDIQEDHSYGPWIYDNTNTCTRNCTKCGASDTDSHVYNVWRTISDTLEESTCSHCNSAATRTTRPHVFSDDTDRYCNNIGCNYDRYTAANHQYEWTGYDSRGIALSYHYQRCETCGYINPDQEDHSYGSWVYDNTNTCTRRCSKCGVSDTESHVHDVWRTISDKLEESTCSHCNSSSSKITRSHVFSDDTDRYCNNPGCNYDRYTAANHQYEWTGYDNRGFALTYHYKRCESCGYNYPGTESHTYNYTNVDSDTCRGTCSKCGLSTDFNHSYTNCADRYCNNNCGRDRGSPGVANADGHVYTNCGDLDCNRAGCSHVRTAASADHLYKWTGYDNNGYALSYHYQRCETCGYNNSNSSESHTYNYSYVNDSTCKGTCSKCGLSTNVSHVYSNCQDTICNRCSHTSRGAIYGNLFSDGHVYFDCSDQNCGRCSHDRGAAPSGSILYADDHVYSSCTDTSCNRTGCGHARTALSHTYTYKWVDVATSGTCEKYVGTCSICDYSYVSSYDYTHAYTNCADSICNDCGFKRDAPGHTYTYKTVNVGTASTCQKSVGTCSKCGYSFVASYDYTHNMVYISGSGNMYRCSACGYTRYGS